MVDDLKFLENVEFNEKIVSFCIFEHDWLTREQERIPIFKLFFSQKNSRETAKFSLKKRKFLIRQ